MLAKYLIITRYSFTEIFKSKILYVTLAVGVATMLMTYVATEFTYGVPEKVAIDFGLGMLSLSSLGIALFMGATLMPKEIESRTIYMVISRPVPRWVFISGKLSGLSLVLLLNLIILSGMTLLTNYLLGGQLSAMTFVAIGFNLLEAILLLMVVVLFSLFSNTIITVVISLILLVAGHAIKETQNILFVQGKELLKGLLSFYHMVLPAFYKLNFKDFVLYNQSVEPMIIMKSLLYGVTYSLFLFFIIVAIFNRKNLD